MTQRSKKSHYIFNRYVRTPQPGSNLEQHEGQENELESKSLLKSQIEKGDHEKPTRIEEENEPVQDTTSISLHFANQDAKRQSKTPGSNVSKVQTGTKSAARSGKDSRALSSRAKTAVVPSKPGSRLKSNQSQKPGSAQNRSKIVKSQGTPGSGKEDDEADNARMQRSLKDRILHFSEGEGSDEDGSGFDEFASEDDENWDESASVTQAPRGSTRERIEQLREEPDEELSWVPKFITAAEAVLPGTDSDYDTDLELDDVKMKLEIGIQNIYEGSGRTMYEATCRTEGVVPISFMMERMENRCVTMRHHYMNDREAVCLANGLKHNTMTEELDLVDNGIGTIGGRAFAEMAVKNKFLLRLNLAQNKLGNEGVYPFYRALERHDNLQTLVLRNNGLTRTGLKEFCKALRLNNGLQVLDISENLLEAQSAMLVFEALMQNLSLFDLDISWNRIQGDKVWKLFAKMLKANNSLEIFNFAKNGSGDRFFSLTFKMWKKQGGIKMLDVSENRLTMLAVKKMSLALTKNTTLEYLRLGGNQIGDDGVVWLLKKVLNKNMTIRVLSIENVRISPEMMETIAELQSDNDRFIIIYGNGRDISSHVVGIIDKVVKYMKENEIPPLELYFQKPTKSIPPSAINKVELDELEKLKLDSVIHRLKLLNINFNDDQIRKLLLYMEVDTVDDIKTMVFNKPTGLESDDEASDELFSLNAWEPKMHRWLEKQLKLLTAIEIADFCWNFHRYFLYLKAKIIATREQQNVLLDSKVLKLITLRELTQQFK